MNKYKDVVPAETEVKGTMGAPQIQPDLDCHSFPNRIFLAHSLPMKILMGPHSFCCCHTSHSYCIEHFHIPCWKLHISHKFVGVCMWTHVYFMCRPPPFCA